jgi:ABC-2 type transport system permease protein
MMGDRLFRQLLKWSPSGTLPWLLAYELQLWWRELKAKWFLLIVGILAAGGVLLLGLSWFVINVWGGGDALLSIPDPLPLMILQIGGGAWLFLLIYAFIQAMQQSLIALFDRGDLDLLVSSPIPPKLIFASRLLSVSIEVFVGFLSLIIPATLLFLLIGWFQLLALYPSLLSVCLLSTSGAMLLNLWLVRWIGVKRARTVSQILTMAIAASFFVGIQLINLSVSTSMQDPAALDLPIQTAIAPWMGPDSWIWIPVRAMFADLPSLAMVLVVSGGVAWATVELLNRQFVESTQQVLSTKRSPRSVTQRPFRQGINVVALTKEWRIILRSPYLLSRMLLSLVFLIPLMVWVLYGQDPRSGLDIQGIATVALPTSGAFLASSLGVICIAGEEAPDLIKSSPVSGQRVRLLKVLAILLPVWGLLAVFFMALMAQGVDVGLGIGLVILSTVCTTLIRLWNARPISLSGMMMRRRENAFNDTILGILESMLFFVWVILGTQANSGNWFVVGVILVFLAMIMAIAYWRSRALGSSLGF